MTPVLRFFAATAIAAGVVVTQAAAQDPPQTATPQTARAQAPVAIIGCVERALPPLPDDPSRTTPPPVGAQQSAAPDRSYKLIDTQPGGGSPVMDATGRVVSTPKAEAPAVVDPQYWLAGPATIDFAKYQNQRVEIIGHLSPIATPGVTPATPPHEAPKSLLTATSVRVVSTECKGSR
jgi:hypothetical protein